MKYKLLGKSGLRVSEICLGTMTFGTDWGYGADKEESKKQFDAFLNAGGNFFDTANRYTEGTSERFLGEFIQQERDRIVLATKYSLLTTKGGHVNDGGNHRKNMIQSVEGSLKRLNTNFIDVLYLHAWDFATPIEEILRGLDDLVRMGKVMYIAISDTPAWIVSRANAIAELRGWVQFIGFQGEYSLIQRTPERDLLPMCKELDLGYIAWGPLAGGALTGKYLTDNNDPKRLQQGSKRLDERSTSIAKEVVAIAEEIGCSPSHVALNWVRQRPQVVIPVVGARTTDQVKDSMDCVNFKLPEEKIIKLDQLSKIELGFPHDFLAGELVRDLLFNGQYGNVVNHRL